MLIYVFLALFTQPLEALALLLGFMSALFIVMPFHEFAHAYVAVKEGDYTPKALRRYTLAPFAHIDVQGLIFLLLFSIGFAKPVPVNYRNMKNGRKSQIKVALAGVTMNLLLGILGCFVFSLLSAFWPALFESYGFISMAYRNFFDYFIYLNFMFAVFNILPIYPLDGFRVVQACSKPSNGFVNFMMRNSFWIMLVLLITGILGLFVEFFGMGLADLIITGFDKFFALF